MEHRPLKIAFIGARGVGGTYSGIETYYEELGSRLAARGHEVTAYCRNHFTPDVPTFRGIKVRRLPALANKHLETISHSVLSTVDCLRRDFDIVQYHAIGSAPLSVIPKVFGHKTIVSVRGLDWQRAKWGRVARSVLKFGERASARCPDATCVVSGVLQEHYEREHKRRPHMIPNAVVPAVRSAPDLIRKWDLGEQDFILYAGRISPEKRIDQMLDALRPRAGKIKIAIAGGGSYAGDYEKLVASKAFDGVRFLGSVDRPTMHELLTNCYAYVLPSVMEGLSISLLEAVSYGCCIVASDIPENLEVIGDAGVPFAVDNTASLAGALGRVIDTPGLAAQMRSKAARRATTLADWDDVTRMTEEFYYEVVGASVDAEHPATADRIATSA